ncbi:zinc ribbon domain-containing protein [Saxibacter everestensis]|uniref:Zinc ribbon domain-containing protein n=1 Tax=Saxibacter everestensis TaxID=2909229 RepID=A0ABY8QWZ4_9MICO|nr:zinc ribbon domain-containing protein [Brevibacteriaceae bacterium ZFBP1038]
MPQYAYACTACDNKFDIQQSFSDAALTVCPSCEGRLRKVFGTVGVVFKGSGFYRNDSRSTSSGSAAAKKSPAESSASGSGSTSSDSKSGSASTGASTSSSSSSSSSDSSAAKAPAAS